LANESAVPVSNEGNASPVPLRRNWIHLTYYKRKSHRVHRILVSGYPGCSSDGYRELPAVLWSGTIMNITSCKCSSVRLYIIVRFYPLIDWQVKCMLANRVKNLATLVLALLTQWLWGRRVF